MQENSNNIQDNSLSDRVCRKPLLLPESYQDGVKFQTLNIALTSALLLVGLAIGYA